MLIKCTNRSECEDFHDANCDKIFFSEREKRTVFWPITNSYASIPIFMKLNRPIGQEK